MRLACELDDYILIRKRLRQRQTDMSEYRISDFDILVHDRLGGLQPKS